MIANTVDVIAARTLVRSLIVGCDVARCRVPARPPILTISAESLPRKDYISYVGEQISYCKATSDDLSTWRLPRCQRSS